MESEFTDSLKQSGIGNVPAGWMCGRVYSSMEIHLLYSAKKFILLRTECLKTVADPGFSRGGGANSPGEAPTYDFAIFSQKLHEMERIWAPRGCASLVPPLRSAT